MKEYMGLNEAPQSGLIEPPRLFSLDFSGRYGRLNYVRAGCLINIPFFLALVPILFLGIIGVLLGALLILFVLIFVARIIILRLHDMNRSAWLALLTFVPVVNFVLGIILLFVPGVKGVNKYGPQTKPSSAAYIVVFVILTLLTLGFYATVDTTTHSTNRTEWI